MYQTIRLETADYIATITLNRPDSYNAFNQQMGEEFLDALDHCEKNDDIRVVVLTGAGKAFCSGQDLKEVKGMTKSLGEIVHERYNPIIRKIEAMPKPFICRLNGVAAGAGASLALICDYVIASERAVLVWAFVNIGLVPDSGSSWLLPRLVGHRKAFELASLGEKVRAHEAQEWGMINAVAPAEELDERIQEVATRYAAAPPIAIGLIKNMINQSYQSSLDDILELEQQGQATAGATEDYEEGVSAFLEKRGAQFKGR
ncbi:MAG: enoyl-CoA hydratase-related protein [Bacteroidota bacterium]